jgi:septation ring formation regulator EzrA
MLGEMNILENKLAQLVQLTKRMRAENHQLRQDLAEALSHVRQNDDKINIAKSRLESILSKLPDEKI